MNVKKRGNYKTVEEVVLANTGLTRDAYLNPKENPYIANMDEAVTFAKDSIARSKSIKIMSDYDCDGVMSGLILYLSLKVWCQINEFGDRTIAVRFPKRFSEGYGLSMNVVDETDNGLLITVDNGITAVDQIKKAKDKGLDVIVIDHHIEREDGILPEADVIVDPHVIKGSEFVPYCGAGLAYKFAEKLLPGHSILPRLLVFAGIATVADVMPIIGDNHRMVKDSLRLINEGEVTYGLSVLLDLLKIEHITEEDYGFRFGPIVNAAGRLYDDGPEKVFDVLKIYSKPKTKITEIKNNAKLLIDTNTKRQQDVDIAMSRVYAQIHKNNMDELRPMVIYDEMISEGIVGIIAGQLAEEYRTPAIVFTKSQKNPDILKGSGRTYGDINLKKLLDDASDLMVGYGGHAGAAGLSVKDEKAAEELQRRLAEIIKDVPQEDTDVNFYDIEATIAQIPFLIDQKEEFAPYGEGNPSPVFLINDFELVNKNGQYLRTMGNGDRHIKLYGPMMVDAVGFDMTGKYMDMEEPVRLKILGTLSRNYFKGSYTNQIDILDMEAAAFKKRTVVYRDIDELLNFID